jgi:NodT family efflux transporter outer membrane factor (OMF) lipoprotein
MSHKPDLRSPFSLAGAALAAVMALFSTACMRGPVYQRPPAPAPAAFKEPPPAGWKEAQPNDGAIRGKWWEIYGDPALNALEEQISISNQNVLAAEAQFRAAKDAVRAARSALYPSVTGGAAITNSRTSTAGLSSAAAASSGQKTSIQFPAVDFSYQVDVWGSIRRSVQASAITAQASAAQLENARLSVQASLAIYYFELHGLDGDIETIENTVRSYEEYLALTRNRVAGGVATGADVAQAETQLNTTRAQLTELGVSRTQYEHAIAILTGRPPSELSIPQLVLTVPPPRIPVGVPSMLLERRPDIANLERQMASQNEQIGIAQAALYPTVSISGALGLQGSSLLNLLNWPSRFWSLGPSAAQMIYDAGKRRAILKQEQDLFDVNVANYRQTVLTAFQQVEDALSSLRILESESGQVKQAVDAARRSLDISTAQYKAGVVSYLPVLTAQTSLLSNQRSAVDLLTRRLTASVQLIEALGGGWNASQLPTVESLKARTK